MANSRNPMHEYLPNGAVLMFANAKDDDILVWTPDEERELYASSTPKAIHWAPRSALADPGSEPPPQ